MKKKINPFSRTEYRKRRRQGLRGQTDDTLQPKIILPEDVPRSETAKPPTGVPRYRRRKRIIDRLYNKRGYRNGRIILGIAKRKPKKVAHTPREEIQPAPMPPTNYQRHQMRKAERQAQHAKRQ